jgi:aminoglycoside phosphotransferase (APT) family kinase protein
MPPSPLSASVLAWLGHELPRGTHILSAQQVSWATSSSVYILRTRLDDREQDIVLRLYTKHEWLAEEPDVPAHEVSSLRKAESAGLPAPRMLAHDLEGAACGVPALLMTHLPGAIFLTPPDMEHWLRQIAGFYPRLHAISGEGHPWRYAGYTDRAALRVPAWSTDNAAWEKALAIGNGPAPAFQPYFIHRDFHPVNMLFQDGQLTGVVDWPNACLGPVGADVAHTRINLAFMYGLVIADRFLEICQETMRAYWQYDPHWDLMAILDFLPDEPGVYPPWITFGLRDLTPALMAQRTHAYLASVLARF